MPTLTMVQQSYSLFSYSIRYSMLLFRRPSVNCLLVLFIAPSKVLESWCAHRTFACYTTSLRLRKHIDGKKTTVDISGEYGVTRCASLFLGVSGPGRGSRVSMSPLWVPLIVLSGSTLSASSSFPLASLAFFCHNLYRHWNAL